MKAQVITFHSLSDLIEEVELLEKVHNLTMAEFDDLCQTLTADELWDFCRWLDKWGLL